MGLLAAAALAMFGGVAQAGTLVVGGSNAPNGSWPSIVALVTPGQTPSAGQFCGGTLIDPSFVVTAAHCVTDFNTGNVVAPATIDVGLGFTSLPTVVTPPAGTWQRIAVQSIARNPTFNVTTLENDVAVLHLAQPAAIPGNPPNFPVATSDLVSPVDGARWAAGATAEIAGWGNTSASANVFVNPLQEAQVPIDSDAFCGGPSSYGPGFFPVAMVCAGPINGGVDTCQGDSGGPLMVRDATNVRVLVGATSFGKGCAQPNFPGVYTQLDTYRSFVYAVVGVSPPAGPTIGTVTPGLHQASVTWTGTPPAANGGRSVTGYRVTTLAGTTPEASADVSANITTAQATNLTCGAHRFAIQAANAAGFGPAALSSVFMVATDLAPVDNALPAITGSAGVGRALQSSPGQWANCPDTLTPAWQIETGPGSGVFTDVPGAGLAQYTVASTDVGRRVRLRIIAANPNGTVEALSAPTAAIPPVPASLVAPVIAGGARVGSTLSATGGAWNVPDPPQLDWQRETAPGSGAFAPIPGATGTSYVSQAGDAGRAVIVTETVVNASGSGSAESNRILVRPVFALRAAAAPRVAIGRSGIATITLRIHLEAGSHLTVRALDPRGRALAPLGRSRIDGLRPAITGRRATATLGGVDPHTVRIVLRGHATGRLRTVTIRMTGTSDLGEAVTTAVKARIRL